MSNNSPYTRMIDKNVNNGLNVRDEYKHFTVDELREIYNEDSIPFQCIFMNLTGELNIGNMIRTACLSGCEKVHIFGRRRYDRRSTTGAHQYIPTERHSGFVGDSFDFDESVFLNIINENNLYPVFIEQEGIYLNNFDWNNTYNNINGNICLIVGNEENGVPNNFFSVLNNHTIPYSVVSIPQKGVMRSFNVGIALSMVIWDMRKELGWI